MLAAFVTHRSKSGQTAPTEEQPGRQPRLVSSPSFLSVLVNWLLVSLVTIFRHLCILFFVNWLLVFLVTHGLYTYIFAYN